MIAKIKLNYRLLLIKRLNTATIYHTHGLTITITITKQCGGTPVSFASALFNLEQKQVVIYVHLIFSDIVIL